MARKTWRTLEAYHGMIYFVPEAEAAYAALGLEGRQGYFASRSAAMGAVPAEVVIATFFNFSPALVRRAIPSAWDVAPPPAVLEARLSGADAALRRMCEDAPASEAVELARAAAERAAERPEGRPLFAAHTSLPWPDEPHLSLWMAITWLREFRGDGHIAALTMAGLTGCEALVLHAGSGEVPASVLQSSRAWDDESWSAAVTSLAERGWVDGEGALTAEGAAQRDAIEQRTDELALPAWEAIGEDGCARLRELVRPLSKAIVASGGIGFR